MRVAQFIHRYPPAIGGAESWAARLSRHLAACGHDVQVWTTTALDQRAFSKRGGRETSEGTSVEDGVEVRRFAPSYRFPGRKLTFRAASFFWPPGRAFTQHWSPQPREMWQQAGEGSAIDVVHAIAFPHGAIMRSAMRLADKTGAKFVVTPFLHLGDLENPDNRIRRAYTDDHLLEILRRADRVLVMTPTEGTAVKALGVPEDRIVLQGLGVDPAECTGGDRQAARRRWGIGPEEYVVGHLATLSREKGTIDLLAAADIARENGAAVKIVLAGAEASSYRGCFEGILDKGITWLGEVDDTTRRDFFAGIDAFVLPSISDSFGLVFLEAWANRLPVIGYRAGGVVDVIRDGVDGQIIPCGDWDSLSWTIWGHWQPRADLRTRLGEAGACRLPTDFRWVDKFAIAQNALTVWP